MVTLTLSASDVTLASPSGTSSSGSGHFVVYIDAPPVAAGAPVNPGVNVVSSAATNIPIAGLVVGRHRFTAVLADGAGDRLGSASAAVSVTVDGPSVVAQVVGQASAGHALSLSLSSYGVTIVDIPTDTSGHTAHYDILIDRSMPEPGTVPQAGLGLIDTTGSLVTIPPLSAGTHVIWVVLVNGAGRTLAPLSAAELILNLH